MRGVGFTAGPAVAAPTTASTSLAEQRFDAMTPAERVGQLLMIGCPSNAAPTACLTVIRAQHVGSVILDGNSSLALEAAFLLVKLDDGNWCARQVGTAYNRVEFLGQLSAYTHSILQDEADGWLDDGEDSSPAQ